MLNFFLSRSKPEKNRLNQNRPNNKSWIFDQREKKKRTKLFFCRSGEKLDRFIIFGAILIGLTGYFSRRKLPNWPSRPTAADSARGNFLLPLKNYLWVWPTLVFFCWWRFSVSGSTIDLFRIFGFCFSQKRNWLIQFLQNYEPGRSSRVEVQSALPILLLMIAEFEASTCIH